MKGIKLLFGLDVHKDSITIAIVEAARRRFHPDLSTPYRPSNRSKVHNTPQFTNAKGVLPQSPGLRACATPGVNQQKPPNRNAVVAE